MKKALVVCITILFFGVSVTSSIGISNSIDDNTPPVTTCMLDPPVPDGLNDYYISNVNVTLEATDDLSGVKEIYYRLAGDEWNVSTGNVVIFIMDYDCLNYGKIEFYAVDFAGNQEEIKSYCCIKIDQLPPFFYLSYEVIGGNPLHGWDLLFTAEAWDDCSGIERVEFLLNGRLQDTVSGPGPNYQWGFKWSGGLKIIIEVRACDFAGNCADKEMKIKFIYNSITQSIHPLFLRLIEWFPILEKLLCII